MDKFLVITLLLFLLDESWQAAITCTLPPDPSPGTTRHGMSIMCGALLTYTCDEGYEYTEGTLPVSRCLRSGMWSHPTPSCTRVSCGEPTPPITGTLLESGTSFLFGDTLTYQCQLGFEFSIGSLPQLTCQADRTWNVPVPQCTRILCGPPQSPAPGTVAIGTSYYFDDVVTYRCEDGFEYTDGDLPELFCLADSQWSDPVPLCTRIMCYSLDTPAYGTMASLDGSMYEFGTTVTYRCRQGFEYTPGTLPVLNCTSTREWSDAVPQCTRILCPAPPGPGEGTIASGTSYTFKSVITYACADGYTYTGNVLPELRCMADRVWNNDVPQCTRISCGAPPPSGGTMATGTSYLVDDVVTYECEEGFEYISGDLPELTCQTNGQWSSSPPHCTPVSCGPPPSPAEGTMRSGLSFTYRSVVTYSCQDGYVGESTEMTCQANRQWGGRLPQCAPPSSGCRPPTPSNDGTILVGTDFSIGSKVDFACLEGYEYVGTLPRLTCLTSREWSGPIPECIRISCSKPLNPDPGSTILTGTDFRYGDQVTISCVSGFQLSGPSTSTCQTDKSWSIIPVCTDINECATQDNNCDDLCINTVGSYVCECNPSLITHPDGVTCKDRDVLSLRVILNSVSGNSASNQRSCTAFQEIVTNAMKQVNAASETALPSVTSTTCAVTETDNGNVALTNNIAFPRGLTPLQLSAVSCQTSELLRSGSSELDTIGNLRYLYGQGNMKELFLVDCCFLYNKIGYCPEGATCVVENRRPRCIAGVPAMTSSGEAPSYGEGLLIGGLVAGLLLAGLTCAACCTKFCVRRDQGAWRLAGYPLAHVRQRWLIWRRVWPAAQQLGPEDPITPEHPFRSHFH